MASLEPKVAMTMAEKIKILDKVAETSNKTAGKIVVGRLNNKDILEKLTIKFIPTPSQNINSVLGGGFPKGRMTILSGLPDSGKTSLALESIGKNMQENPDFIAGWLESENSLEEDYLVNTFGIDPERFFYIEYEKEGGAERALDIVEGVLSTNVCDIFVINSLKSLTPSEELKKEMGSMQIGLQARLNAKMCRKLIAIIQEAETAFVVTQHLSTMIGTMSRDPLIVSGGHGIIYAASIVADMRKRAMQDTDPIKKEDGIKIGFSIKKNHCVPNRNPYLKLDYYALFGEGIEVYLETIENAVEQGILEKAGSWYREIDPETGTPKEVGDIKYNWQGRDAIRTFCIENPDYFKELQSKVSGTFVYMTEEEIDNVQKEMKTIDEQVDDDLKDCIDKTKSKKVK